MIAVFGTRRKALFNLVSVSLLHFANHRTMSFQAAKGEKNAQ